MQMSHAAVRARPRQAGLNKSPHAAHAQHQHNNHGDESANHAPCVRLQIKLKHFGTRRRRKEDDDEPEEGRDGRSRRRRRAGQGSSGGGGGAHAHGAARRRRKTRLVTAKVKRDETSDRDARVAAAVRSRRARGRRLTLGGAVASPARVSHDDADERPCKCVPQLHFE